MGLGGAARGGMAFVAFAVIAGYALFAVLVTLAVRWISRSWRIAGWTFAGFVVVAGLVAWSALADERARARALDQAYEITDPLWRAAGLGPERAANGLEDEPCWGRGVTTVFTAGRTPDAAAAITAVGARLDSHGWKVVTLVDPEHQGPWVYASRGGDAVVVWAGEPDWLPDEGLRMEVRLGDCYLLTAASGTVEEPNCARGGSIQCVDRLRVRDRG